MANYRPNNIKDIVKIYNPIFSSGNSTGQYPKELIQRTKGVDKKIKI